MDAELKSTLDFTLATIDSCTIGLVVEARGLSAACRSESRGSWANLGKGWRVVQLPLSTHQGPLICRSCSLSWKRRTCCNGNASSAQFLSAPLQPWVSSSRRRLRTRSTAT